MQNAEREVLEDIELGESSQPSTGPLLWAQKQKTPLKAEYRVLVDTTQAKPALPADAEDQELIAPGNPSSEEAQDK